MAQPTAVESGIILPASGPTNQVIAVCRDRTRPGCCLPMNTRTCQRYAARPYRHRCVADLAWALSSPPMLSCNSSDCEWFSGAWYEDLYAQIEPRLRQLDRAPSVLKGLLAAQKDQRLGSYFETLWAYALQLHPRYQLVERNLQIQDEERTVGEMDFIVLDRQTGRYAHWELAIKFYLGTGNTVRHDAWLGPGAKDRLDLKINHLMKRQTVLSRHPAARALLERKGIAIDDCAVILKGRLFYPWQQDGPKKRPMASNPAHLLGRWLTRGQLEQAFTSDARFEPLIRSGWMQRNPTSQDGALYSVSGLIGLMDKGKCRLPLQVARLEGEFEMERLFIVGNNWPHLQA